MTNMIKEFKQYELTEQGNNLPENIFRTNANQFRDIQNRIMYITHTVVGADAATAANYGVFCIVPVTGKVTKIQEVHQTLGTDGGAVILTVEKLTGTQALDAGVSLLNSTINLKGTINTVVTPELNRTITNLMVNTGDRLALKDSGTLTAVANVTILIEITY